MGVPLLLAQGTAGLCCGDHIHTGWSVLLDRSLQQCHHQQPAAHIKRGSATQTLPTTASLLGRKPQDDRSPGVAWQAGSWSLMFGSFSSGDGHSMNSHGSSPMCSQRTEGSPALHLSSSLSHSLAPLHLAVFFFILSIFCCVFDNLNRL